MNRYFKLLLVGIISAVGIYLAFKDDDFGELVIQIQQIAYTGVFIASLLLIISCIVRAYRWQLLMDPVERIPFHDVFAATMVGYFGNGILAFRLGELLRAYSVTSGREMSATQAFGTVILERILDLLMVILVFVLVIPWFPFDLLPFLPRGRGDDANPRALPNLVATISQLRATEFPQPNPR